MQKTQSTRTIIHPVLALRWIILLIIPVSTVFLLYSPSPQAHADGFPVIGTLYTGGHPEALAVDTQTHLVYIGVESPGAVVCFDPISGHVRWRVKTAGTITDLQVDSTRNVLYAFQQHPGGLLIFNGSTGQQLDFLSTHDGDNNLAVDTKTDSVFVLNRDDSTILIFSFPTHWPEEHNPFPLTPVPSSGTYPANAILVRTLTLGGQPAVVGINGRSGRLYVADNGSHTLKVFDEHKLFSGTTVTLASIPLAAWALPPIRVNEATGRVFVLCSTGQELDVIDGQTNHVIARTAVEPYPEGVAINTATGRIYVADEGDREDGPGPVDAGTTISVLDGHSYALLGTMKVGQAPDGADADPALHRVYIALEDSGAVVEISDSTALPLQTDLNALNAQATQRALVLLRWATLGIVIAILLTLSGSTLVALSQRWRGKGNPRTPRGDVSSRSGSRSPRH